MDSSHIFPHQETQEAVACVAAASSTLSGQRLGVQRTRRQEGERAPPQGAARGGELIWRAAGLRYIRQHHHIVVTFDSFATRWPSAAASPLHVLMDGADTT